MGSGIVSRQGWWFFGFAGLFYLFALGLKFDFFDGPVLLRNHFADLLFVPLWLGISLFVFRLFFPRYSFLPKGLIIGMTVYAGIFFEYFLPQYSPKYTQDYWDVFAYGLGCLAFMKYQNLWFQSGGGNKA